MSNPILNEVIGVQHTTEADVYSVTATVEIEGTQTQELFILTPNDPYGLAPAIRASVQHWIASGRPVEPAPPPPSAEELRAAMVPLSPRQIRRALASISIVEEDVDAALSGDADGMIEWKWATEFERLHPLVTALAASFNLPPEQVDDLWTWASTI